MRHIRPFPTLGVLLSLLAAAPLSAQDAPYDAVPFARDVMVPMRDGVKLATDIYRPAVRGTPVADKLPVLLQRTPYGKEDPGLVERAMVFVRHGYVVALQDLRGRYESEGSFQKYDDVTAPDGYDTVEWLARLPYVDGQVGMWGTSYGAHTQADAAKMNPPHLKALLLNFGGLSNGWRVKVRNHGAFELAQQMGWAWAEAGADYPEAEAALANEPMEKWFAATPLRRGLSPLALAPAFEDYLLEELTHADYDEYWKGLGKNWSEHYAATADIPMMHVGGWYDSYCGSTIENYVALSALKRSPMRLVMGPWVHGGNARSAAGDVDFGPAGAIADFAADVHVQWFDHHLKGKDTAVGAWSPIRLFVMGTGDGHLEENGRLYHGGYWRDAAAWPLPGTRSVKYYLHADGTLSTTPPGGSIPPTAYTYDPRDPVPTIGGAFSGALKNGPYDQREREFTSPRGGSETGHFGSKPPYLPLSARADVLVFQTEPLEVDVEVIGPITVRLFASSSALDTDFTAKLVDVYPPSADLPSGFDLNLTDGIVRARYRNTPERAELMTPGQVYELVIEPYPTANVFKKGHRIRIDISSSNFPRFDLNPNTGEPLGRSRRMIAADNSIYHDATRASHLVLPIAPAGR
ncbi:MAG: CocE/NonD family hydrolase [Longimicrobiales bacterium]|nr:CocE/NonD family hydrolase [Longimicrobiales bacterium]